MVNLIFVRHVQILQIGVQTLLQEYEAILRISQPIGQAPNHCIAQKAIYGCFSIQSFKPRSAAILSGLRGQIGGCRPLRSLF